MKEKIKIENSKGIIHLAGDKYDSVVYLNTIPIQFTWLREIGSTWRYQIAKNINESDILDDHKFANFVKYGYLTYDTLSVQFDYILNKLTDGAYLLEIDYLPSNLHLVEAQSGEEGCYQNDEYGGLMDIIQTQAYLDEQTIKNYIELIEKEVEPIMVVLKCMNSANSFIIDGHHKFMAYTRLKRLPRALIINKLNCEKINRQTGLSLFKTFNCQNIEYINRFLQTIKK